MVLLYIINAYAHSSNLILLFSRVAGVIAKLAPQFSYIQTDYFSEPIVASSVVEQLDVFGIYVALDLLKSCCKCPLHWKFLNPQMFF